MAGPPKPWERAPGTASRASPLGSSSADDGQAKPWETQSTVVAGDSTSSGQLATSVARPWDRTNTYGQTVPYQAAGTSYNNAYNAQPTAYGGPYGSMPSTSYGGHGSGAYGAGSMYGRPGGSYGSSMYGGGGYGMGRAGMYGSSMYGSGGAYGSSMYGTGAYGGGMYGSGGSSMYGVGTGMYGRPGMMGSPGSMYGGGGMNTMGAIGGPALDHNGMPVGLPPPQTKWETFMNSINGLMHFFGRLSFLVDENAHAVHFFITALLQLLDRASFLYGEIARFILRLFGYKEPKARTHELPAANPQGQPIVPAATAPPVDSFDSIWPGNSKPCLQ